MVLEKKEGMAAVVGLPQDREVVCAGLTALSAALSHKIYDGHEVKSAHSDRFNVCLLA
jgi:hypothetical protein